MKRILYTLIIAAALSACQDELALDPAVSFFSASPELTDETATFRIAFANMPDSTERVFPVRFEGTAELGTDYTVSSDRFVFGGGNPVDAIVVTALKLGTEKTLSLTLDIPEGYAAGKYTTCGYTLQDKIAYFSFDSPYLMVCDSLDLGFTTRDRYGRTKAMNSETEVRIRVNKEKSTAEEGTDFEFADSSRFLIRKGGNSGKLKIKSLNPHPETGREKVVLEFEFGERHSCGEVAELEICLMDTVWSHLDGNWKIDTLVTDSAYMAELWNDECTGYDRIPGFNGSDSFSVSLQDNRFTPSFRSDFRNYFTGVSSLRNGGPMSLDLGEGKTAEIHTFLLDKTNRYFSADEHSEDTESYIGLRFLDSTSGQTDSLDMYIIDHTSRSFMPELEASEKYVPQKPVAASKGLFLNMTFKKD
jgi:hypothetical protein